MKVMKILVILGLGILLDCGCNKKVGASYSSSYTAESTGKIPATKYGMYKVPVAPPNIDIHYLENN